MKFLPVPVDYLETQWQYIEPILNKAVCLSPRKIDIKDVYEASKQGAYLVWTVQDEGEIIAVITTRMVFYPKGYALALDFVGGDKMKDWIELVLSTLEVHARHNKCIHMEGFGRKAWQRFIGKFGWYPAHITYHKDL
tara:strand:+ start:337 stop:747 length:411 start_codon:yes stop_codon:yes gene_type:complete